MTRLVRSPSEVALFSTPLIPLTCPPPAFATAGVEEEEPIYSRKKTPDVMQNLNVPTASDSASVTAGRKRQRSTSLDSATSSSSLKRAASEDNSFSSLDTSISTVTLTSSTFDQDTPMSDLPESSVATSEPPTKNNAALPPEQKHALITELNKQPMAEGETWYLIARSWYRRWASAATGAMDKDVKEGPVDEMDIGPVDNAPLLEENGELKADLVESVDVEYVPKEAWDLFVQWCVTPRALPSPSPFNLPCTQVRRTRPFNTALYHPWQRVAWQLS
jgi:hypothetical protein